nr:MAG TPA: hypothetical protein [Caudoviricetes sp.]
MQHREHTQRSLWEGGTHSFKTPQNPRPQKGLAVLRCAVTFGSSGAAVLSHSASRRCFSLELAASKVWSNDHFLPVKL